jgi:hypothetical protein
MNRRRFHYRFSRVARAAAGVIGVWRHHLDDLDEALGAVESLSDLADDYEDVALDGHASGVEDAFTWIHKRRSAA